MRTLVAALCLVLAGCGQLLPSPSPSPTPGLRIEYRVLARDGRTATSADREVIRSIVQQRLEATGVAWVRVGVPGTDRIVVELPSAGGLAELRALAGATGRLDFVGLGSAPMTAGEPIDLEAHPPLFSGDQVERATLGIDQGGARTIDLVLREPGRRLFADYTAAHVGDTFAIVLDGVILAAPVIQEAIPDGRVQVSPGAAGPLAAADAQRFVTIIRLGALPFPLQEVAVTP